MFVSKGHCGNVSWNVWKTSSLRFEVSHGRVAGARCGGAAQCDGGKNNTRQRTTAREEVRDGNHPG